MRRRFAIAEFGIPWATVQQAASETLTTEHSVAAEIRAQLQLPDARPVRGRAGERIRSWLAVRGIPSDEARELARQP